MENHPGPRLPIFLIPSEASSPSWTLGNNAAPCAEGFPAPAAGDCAFVMAWDRKNGEAGLDVYAAWNHSRSHGWPLQQPPVGHPRAHGERGLSPRLEAADSCSGCPTLN